MACPLLFSWRGPLANNNDIQKLSKIKQVKPIPGNLAAFYHRRRSETFRRLSSQRAPQRRHIPPLQDLVARMDVEVSIP
jgi:hypothetical protein